MEVHKELEKDFSEMVYGDALEIELKNTGINYQGEGKFNITYKENSLPHYYVADFIINHKIVLKIKAIESLTKNHIRQTLNSLAASQIKLEILVNFGEDSLNYKRILL